MLYICCIACHSTYIYIYIYAATDLHRWLRKGQATVAASWPLFPAGSLGKRLLVWKELRSDPQEMEVCKMVLYESGKSLFYTFFWITNEVVSIICWKIR